MSSNTFVDGARMSGVCAFIVGYFASARNIDFSYLPLWYRVHTQLNSPHND